MTDSRKARVDWKSDELQKVCTEVKRLIVDEPLLGRKSLFARAQLVLDSDRHKAPTYPTVNNFFKLATEYGLINPRIPTKSDEDTAIDLLINALDNPKVRAKLANIFRSGHSHTSAYDLNAVPPLRSAG